MLLLTQEQFLKKARQVHGIACDYSLVFYRNCKTKVVILCPQHGPFEQLPMQHLHKGRGCTKCATTFRKDTAWFVEKSRQLHHESYDYSQTIYKDARTKAVIICRLHGLFKQKPSAHLAGRGCAKCANVATLTIDIFIDKATKIHRHKYNYSQVKYVNNVTKIIIICLQHGEFEQNPNAHLSGHGCRKCAQDHAPSWGSTGWASRQAGRPALLYVVRLHCSNEVFFKVGITFYSVKRRFSGSHMPYSLEQVAVFTSSDAIAVHKLEATIKKKFKFLRYKPNMTFQGATECYTISEPIIAHLSSQNFLRHNQKLTFLLLC